MIGRLLCRRGFHKWGITTWPIGVARGYDPTVIALLTRKHPHGCDCGCETSNP